MKPLVKEFRNIFEEEFKIDVEGQLRHKESTKVLNLIYTDIQGAVRTGFKDPELKVRYLKAIIEEKMEECDVEVIYETHNNPKISINVFEFLSRIVGNIEYKPTFRATKPIKSKINDVSLKIDKDTVIQKGVIMYCPHCNNMLRSMNTANGELIYYCRNCNIGYENISSD